MRQAIAITTTYAELLNHPIAILFVFITFVTIWKIAVTKGKVKKI